MRPKRVLLDVLASCIPCTLLCTSGECAPRQKRSDDVTPLQVVVDGHSQQLVQINAQLAALQNKYSALEDKLNIVQTNVAFYAYNSNDPFSVASHGTIVYNTVNTNIGNGYDPQSGYFTAPVSGTYSFFINCMAVDKTAEEPSIISGTTVIAACYSSMPSDGPYEQGATQGITHLTAGQKVRVRLLQSAENVRGHRWNTFSGFLVRADA